MSFYIDSTTDIDPLISKEITFNEYAIALKLDKPTFGVRESYNVDFQPILTGSHSGEPTDDNAYVVFPLIHQYLHNFYEIFSKILNLKNSGESFTVMIVRPEGKDFDDLFYSLHRNHPDTVFNTSHVKDFLDFIEVSFICSTPEELADFKFKSAYAFFELFDYSEHDLETYEGARYTHLNKKYYVSHFLQTPYIKIVLKDIETIRKSIPNYSTIEDNKIFISRKKARDRRYQYEDQLEDIAEAAGYTLVNLEDYSWLDQLKIVKEASHILCLYGSGLVNCGLANPETKVGSINPTADYLISFYDPIFNQYNITHKTLNTSAITFEDSKIIDFIHTI